ncbi:O-antigen ligase family protein [Mesorhizobium sp. KR9-304]|uniref:O-antigen ligase family protein n=1 Tax=Mesorhizobium sp. KR9-304 TaxID=3156614 RepID=UPI0032B44B18
MSSKPRQIDKYLLGSVLFLALLIGGGTASGLYTDTIIEILAVVAAAVALSAPSEHKIDRRAFWLLLAILALALLQLVPLPAALLEPFRPELLAVDVGEAGGPSPFQFISLGIGRTSECLVYFAAAAAFFLGVSKLRPEQVYGLLPFFFMGVICNALAGAIQYSLSENVSIDGLLPFTISVGLFANVNHFSSLLFITIPFVVYYGLFRGHLFSGIAGLGALLLLLLAAGSRAGVLIGLAITLISVFFLASRSRASATTMLTLFLAMSVYSIGAWSKIDAAALDPEFGRREFAETTIAGIKDNWLFGIGFGNFQKGYQIYEREEMIFSQYVNHAHNEYLEAIFEGGVIAGLAILFYLVVLAVSVFGGGKNTYQKAALLSIIFILVHSFVDYPLRTIALALTFAYLNAIVFHTGFGRRNNREELLAVEHNGGQLLVPI